VFSNGFRAREKSASRAGLPGVPLGSAGASNDRASPVGDAGNAMTCDLILGRDKGEDHTHLSLTYFPK
jgi:hypothetical protein